MPMMTVQMTSEVFETSEVCFCALQRAVGSTHVVATGFNPLEKQYH